MHKTIASAALALLLSALILACSGSENGGGVAEGRFETPDAGTILLAGREAAAGRRAPQRPDMVSAFRRFRPPPAAKIRLTAFGELC